MPPHDPSTDDFAAELKRSRLAAGLSQSQLAERAGLTGSYVCLLELRRRPSPTPEVVSALASALGIPDARLQERAALERTPEVVRRRVVRLVRERRRVRRTRDRLLTTTLFHMSRRPDFLPDHAAQALGLPDDRRMVLARLAGRMRDLPNARQAEKKAPEILREVSSRDRDALVRVLPQLWTTAHGGALPAAAPAPARAPEERPWQVVPVLAAPPAAAVHPTEAVLDRIHVDRRLWRPGAYVLVAADDDAYPRIESGDWLLIHPGDAAPDGAWVVWIDGDRVRLRIVRRQADHVRLESARPDVPPIRVAPGRFAASGVVAWVFRPMQGAPSPRPPAGT
jgi:transcriptional regulator with XRE-family HTH domain